ncbi:HET domain-containing protein [Fusarium sp. Ph1]|nr:HET domain-containing protein [Fusarium sp. Ph1]
MSTHLSNMSTPPDLPRTQDGFESDDPTDYWAGGDGLDYSICRDFNPRYLHPDDTSNNHRCSSLVRSARDGCFTCKILEEIIIGLYKFEDASTIAFTFEDNHFVPWPIWDRSVHIGSIELHRTDDIPCPWGLVYRESNHPESTASQASHSWVEGQLQTCLTQHLGCGATADDPLLPTRVLDMGTGGSKTIKVLETKGLRAKYITLSHCWGDPALMPTKLTAHTRDQYLQGISAKFTRPKLISTWYDIISEYTSTSLTHVTDKLVAIEGIAEYMRPLRNSECLAGLWADSCI